MSAITKYLIFVIILITATYAAAGLNLPFVNSASGKGQTGVSSVISGALFSGKPAYILSGPQNLAAIDYSPENNITAAGGTGAIMLWRLPEEKPVFEIDTGEGFQALSLLFLKEENIIAAGGRTMDNTGSIRLFDIFSGKLILQIDDPEPVMSIDFHYGGKYLLATGASYIKIWDFKNRNAIVTIPKSNPESRGYFFMEGRYVLQSDPLLLYDWTERKGAGLLDTLSPLVFKKSRDNTKYAWITGSNLSIISTPNGRKELIPLNAKGIFAFDIAPDGRWGLFLKDSQNMAVLDLVNMKLIKTIRLDSPPVDIVINSDGSSAYVICKSGNIEVFDIGNKNTLRNIRFYAVKFFNTAVEKIAMLAKKRLSDSKEGV